MADFDIDDYMKKQAVPASGAAPKLGYGARALNALKMLGKGGLATVPFQLAAGDIASRANNPNFQPDTSASVVENAGGAATGIQRPSLGESRTALRTTGALGVDVAAQNARELARTAPPSAAPVADPSKQPHTAGPIGPNTAQAQIDAAADPRIAEKADRDRADTLLTTIDAQVGRGGYGAAGGYAGADAINERIRGFGADPAALANLNEVQRLNRTGITGTRQANGTIMFSNDPTAPKKTYTGADGQPTTNWEDTQEYQSAIRRNAADTAKVGAIEQRDKFEALETAYRGAKTVTGKRLAAERLNTEMTLAAQRDIAGGVRATAGAQLARQTQKDSVDTQMKLLELQASLGDKSAETKLKQLKIAGIESGKLDPSGSSPANAYQFEPTMEPNKFFRGDRRTGAGALITARPTTQVKYNPTTKKYYEVEGDRVIGEISQADYEKRNK